MRMDELDYSLPPDRIATHPAEPRDHSRLLVYHRASQKIEHRRFYELPSLLLPTDLLILNDTRVLPAKLLLHKPTGATIPGLFLSEKEIGTWEVLLRTRGKAKLNDHLLAGQNNQYHFHLTERLDAKGMWKLTVTPPEPAAKILADIGRVPLPPYIEKQRTTDENALDIARYQTVFANQGKSVAAPTAGLHFTSELLSKLDALGIRRATVNLDVGQGTFLPVETDTLEEHPMHSESYSIPAATIAAIQQQHANNHRILAVGTTSVRTLESAAKEILSQSPPTNIHAATTLKISPGYPFQLTDLLLTNFHLPKSTLLALVAALIGLDTLHSLYQLAIQENYRFYSYGDAMLILP